MVLRFFSLALLFLFASCSVPERDSPYDPKGINYQGGSPPSGGSEPVVSDCSLNGEAVTIGTQVWMKENLNCNISGSRCYNDNPSRCAKYGRLYDWTTAMALPSSCNSSSCSGQVNAKHRGICPSGWHIPSNADWATLTDYVGGASTAGEKLKATSGWEYNGNGTDNFGFTALPGGYGGSGGDFYDVGYNGNWWSAIEKNANSAYYRRLYHGSDDYYAAYGGSAVYGGFRESSKSDLLSVRCVKSHD